MRVETIGDATLYLGDCLEILPTLGKVDVLITDPPYNVGKEYGEKYDDSKDDALFYEWSKKWILKAINLADRRYAIYGLNKHIRFMLNTLPDAHLIVYELCGNGSMGGAYSRNCTFIYCRDPIEKIPILWKDGRAISNEAGNMFRPLEHPGMTSNDATSRMVKAFSNIGEIVLDPFMGSGTTGVACINLGRKFVGIEIEPKYFDIACRRIESAWSNRPRLFEEDKPKSVQGELLGSVK